ncbi:MAG: putative amidase AmiD [Nitrospira sp.]|nr:putative amidase AmiD [Nitrospira sp.]
MTDELCFLTIVEASERMRSGELTSLELVEAFIARHERIGVLINCYGTFLGERSLKHARALDELRKAGVVLGPLHGIPVAVKDNIDTFGVPTTSGSPIFRDRVPTRDSTVVGRLYAAGAIVLGKANLYEWAYGAPSGLFGDVANPWDVSCTAGASSNGSAAAVAAGLATAAVGTDLGGSVRIPAAMCGIFGLKPKYGSVSRAGVFPPGQTLDHVGPMTHTANDARVLLSVMEGPDPADRNTLGHPPSFDDSHTNRRLGLRVGIANPQAGHPIDSSVQDCFDSARRVLESLGYVCEEVDLPSLTDARTAMWTISAVEGAEVHLPLLQSHIKEYAEKPRRLLLGGLVIPAVDYVRAQRVRSSMATQMSQIFEKVDVVLSPMLPRPPWDSSLATTVVAGVVEDNMAAMTHFTPLYNLTGHPAASFLAGFSEQGLPVALQLASPLNGVANLLNIVSAFEAETKLTNQRPTAVR